MSLLPRVVAVLTAAHAEHALIGAAAMAVHGVSRATFDIDLFTLDRRVLGEAFWISLSPSAAIDIRRGDHDDPLAGVVRISASTGRDIDVVVGRSRWQQEVLARASQVEIDGTDVRVADPVGLVLLKLYAGGLQDAWDIQQLLSVVDRARIVAEVTRLGVDLPESSRALWARIVGNAG